MKTTEADVERALQHALESMAEGEFLVEEERFVDAHVQPFPAFRPTANPARGMVIRLKGGESFAIHIRRRS